MTLPFPDWFGAPSVAPVVAVDAAAARSMRLASAPMYVCAICSVSYLDSLWSGRFVNKTHQHAHVHTLGHLTAGLPDGKICSVA